MTYYHLPLISNSDYFSTVVIFIHPDCYRAWKLMTRKIRTVPMWSVFLRFAVLRIPFLLLATCSLGIFKKYSSGKYPILVLEPSLIWNALWVKLLVNSKLPRHRKRAILCNEYLNEKRTCWGEGEDCFRYGPIGRQLFGILQGELMNSLTRSVNLSWKP